MRITPGWRPVERFPKPSCLWLESLTLERASQEFASLTADGTRSAAIETETAEREPPPIPARSARSGEEVAPDADRE
jgi:hypothetical protein